MNQKVIAIGIDAPDNGFLVELIEAGTLPNLAKLRSQSLSGIARHGKKFSNQNSWANFLSGISIENLDYWVSEYTPDKYDNINKCLYNYRDHEPFYAFDDKQVVVFDLPTAISDEVSGVQIVGWASELNETYPESRPAGLIEQIHERYGLDPKQETALKIYNAREGKHGYSYRVPSAYDLDSLVDFRDKLRASVAMRTRICLDLMAENAWDLFITSFSELHVGGHTLWHVSRDHPLDLQDRASQGDLLLDLYIAVDDAIGELVDNAPSDVPIVLFTVDSIVADCLENPRSVFLPELFYRWCFHGKSALSPGDPGTPVAPPTLNHPEHWKHEIWKLRTADAHGDLQSPLQQEAQGDTFSWQPTNWYRPVWPRMKAFALPSVADGYVRINVQGREKSGIVAHEDYDAVCGEVEAMLLQARDARTNRPIVERVIRVRQDPFAQSAGDPPADLVVLFSEEHPTDTVDHPDLGRIGPVPFFRPGGHQKQDSVIENPFMIRPGSVPVELRNRSARLEDIPATITHLLGSKMPDSSDGTSLVRIVEPAAA